MGPKIVISDFLCEIIPKESLPLRCIEDDKAPVDNLGACPLDCLAHCSTAAARDGLASGNLRALRPIDDPSMPKSNSGGSLKIEKSIKFCLYFAFTKSYRALFFFCLDLSISKRPTP